MALMALMGACGLDKVERMKVYGRELRRRRIEAGFQELKEFAARIGVSNQHLSQVETAYSRDGRPAVGLGDDVMEAVARELKWKVIDQRRVLGQIPESEIEYVPVEEDEAELLRFLRNQPPGVTPRALKALKAMFEEDDEEERSEGRHGGRAE
jgi:transcriptional regulator with XRE-family HTH domain